MPRVPKTLLEVVQMYGMPIKGEKFYELRKQIDLAKEVIVLTYLRSDNNYLIAEIILDEKSFDKKRKCHGFKYYRMDRKRIPTS